MRLIDLINDDKVSITEIGAHLDALSSEERRRTSLRLGRAAQRRLYQKAAQGQPARVTDFVPEHVPARSEVICAGKNTLPLPPPFRTFEKRFYRHDDVVGGYNEGASRPLIGPGYFVLKPTAGNPAWESRGSMVVDYFEVPQGPVVEGWPRVVRNSQGLQVLVFHRTRDFMRRVSNHVTIGAAYKGENALDHYFILCRQDA